MGMSCVTTDSVGYRKTSSKDLGLGFHFTVIYELSDLEQITYLPGPQVPHLYDGQSSSYQQGECEAQLSKTLRNCLVH